MRVLDSVDSGSNYSFGDKLQIGQMPRSAFDLSHLNTLTVPNAGLLFPVLLTEVLPKDHIDLKINALLRVLPQVVPLYTRQRLYFDAFYVRCSDCWKNANTYFKKGKKGTTLLTRPALTIDNISPDGLTITASDPTDPSTWTKAIVQPNSIYDLVGIPIGTDLVSLINKGYHIDALPFMALLQIYRWYFLNKNAYINDDAMFPDDEADFRLDNNGKIISFVKESVSTNVLGSSMYRLYPQDYFTSALPFPQRGDAPTLPLSFDSTQQFDMALDSIDAKDNNTIQLAFGSNPGTLFSAGGNVNPNAPGTLGFTNKGSSVVSSYTDAKKIQSEDSLLLKNVNFSTGILRSNIVLDDIRRLAIAQLELERMARTDGTYEEFGLSFFNVVSRNAVDYKPLYVGSCYQDVSFSEVLQTSSTDAQSPLGAYAGHGVSVTQDGNIGSFDSDDYGYLVVLASVMPDVYYHQGLKRMFTKSVQKEEFLPNRDKMGMRGILNQEIFLSGTKATDEDLFAYQNPFDEYRYLENEIHGKIADSSNLSFSPYTQAREFSQTPNWNNDFLTAKNVRKDYLNAPTEDAYTMQVRFDIRAVRPLSYVAQPAEVMN